MRDRKKFCIPKIAKPSKIGDVVVLLKGGKSLTVPYKEFKKVSNFFKIKSFKGEGYEIPGNLRMSSKDFTGSGIFSPSNYTSLEDNFTIEEIIGNKQNPQDGDVLVYNSYIDESAVFSFSDWVNSDDSWEITGLQGITTYEEEDASNGDYVILANGTTLIIKPADYSKVSSHWELVDTIVKETKLICKYNITDTTNSTTLLSGYESGIFTSMEVDETQLDNVVTSYTFSTTGEHTVKYELLDETKLGNQAPVFNNSNLVECIIPYSVTSISNNVFVNCTNLTIIDIPNSVTSIGGSAFGRCSGLTSVTVNAATPPTLGSNVFDNTNNCPIYVPSASVETYKSTSGWSGYASRILAIP